MIYYIYVKKLEYINVILISIKLYESMKDKKGGVDVTNV